MVTTLIVLSVVISVLLICIVLIQKSKGGGLASNFAGSNQIMGVRRTTDFIEKATWTLACIIAVLALISGVALRRSHMQNNDPSFRKESPAATGNENVNILPTSTDASAPELPATLPAADAN